MILLIIMKSRKFTQYGVEPGAVISYSATSRGSKSRYIVLLTPACAMVAYGILFFLVIPATGVKSVGGEAVIGGRRRQRRCHVVKRSPLST